MSTAGKLTPAVHLIWSFSFLTPQRPHAGESSPVSAKSCCRKVTKGENGIRQSLLAGKWNILLRMHAEVTRTCWAK